jgi:Na+/melibiose symporter-like transporter
MLADVVDLDSLKTGGRRAGTFFALNGMIAKISAMLAVWAAAILVDFSGFIPGTENNEGAILGPKDIVLSWLRRLFSYPPYF